MAGNANVSTYRHGLVLGRVGTRRAGLPGVGELDNTAFSVVSQFYIWSGMPATTVDASWPPRCHQMNNNTLDVLPVLSSSQQEGSCSSGLQETAKLSKLQALEMLKSEMDSKKPVVVPPKLSEEEWLVESKEWDKAKNLLDKTSTRMGVQQANYDKLVKWKSAGSEWRNPSRSASFCKDDCASWV